jgi:hypothetical protein
MPANNDPIFSKQGDLSNNAGTGMNQAITAAANDFTGAGANNSLVFTADGTNGGFVQRLRFKAAGTNVATVARIFLNNGSTNGTASNNTFYGEIALPATTASASSQTGADIDYPMNIALPPGWKIYVGLGTAVAAGWVVTPVAGKY